MYCIVLVIYFSFINPPPKSHKTKLKYYIELKKRENQKEQNICWRVYRLEQYREEEEEENVYV